MCCAAVISGVFPPIIAFTQLPKDLLYEITCATFEPIAGRPAICLNTRTNKGARRRPVGVSSGVPRHDSGAQLGWGCGSCVGPDGASHSGSKPHFEFFSSLFNHLVGSDLKICGYLNKIALQVRSF